MKESNLQKNCIKYCRSEGIYLIAIRGGTISKGSPTLILCLNGRFVAFDLEDETDRKPEKRLHQAKIQANRGLCYYPHSLEEFVGIIREIQRQEVERNDIKS